MLLYTARPERDPPGTASFQAGETDPRHRRSIARANERARSGESSRGREPGAFSDRLDLGTEPQVGDPPLERGVMYARRLCCARDRSAMTADERDNGARASLAIVSDQIANTEAGNVGLHLNAIARRRAMIKRNGARGWYCPTHFCLERQTCRFQHLPRE